MDLNKLSLVLDLVDQPFDNLPAFGLYPADVHITAIRRTPSIHIARWQPFLRRSRNYRGKANRSMRKSTIDEDGIAVMMDVKQFKPNERSVRTIENGDVIFGQHMKFIRKYQLAKEYCKPKSAADSDDRLIDKHNSILNQ